MGGFRPNVDPDVGTIVIVIGVHTYQVEKLTLSFEFDEFDIFSGRDSSDSTAGYHHRD